MKKWQIPGYLIESKKCVDSLMFIDEYIWSLKNLDIKNLMEEKIQKLYINLRVIYDKCLNKLEKVELKDKDKIYTETFYHRDKKYAHKDDNYKKKEYKSRFELIEDLKGKVVHCFEICRSKLPEEITLDFISYDKNLYRLINNITPEKEEFLKRVLYDSTEINEKEMVKEFSAFNDIEDINFINNINEYAVLIENGINLYEGLQNRQDSCIKINVLYDFNIWCQANDNLIFNEKEYEKLIKKILA